MRFGTSVQDRMARLALLRSVASRSFACSFLNQPRRPEYLPFLVHLFFNICIEVTASAAHLDRLGEVAITFPVIVTFEAIMNVHVHVLIRGDFRKGDTETLKPLSEHGAKGSGVALADR